MRVWGKIVVMITINTDWITYINIGVIVLYLIFMIIGARKGILVQILSSLGTVISFLAAWRYCGFASGYYNLWPKDIVPANDIPELGAAIYAHLNELIWFVLLFIIFRLLFLILEKLCSGLSGLPVIKEVSGLFGGILGLVSATIWIMILCIVINMPFFRNGREITEGSLIGKITDTVSGTVKQLAGPVDASETIGNLYQEYNKFGTQDMEAIGEWLSEHGINPTDSEAAEPIEESADPDSATPLAESEELQPGEEAAQPEPEAAAEPAETSDAEPSPEGESAATE